MALVQDEDRARPQTQLIDLAAYGMRARVGRSQAMRGIGMGQGVGESQRGGGEEREQMLQGHGTVTVYVGSAANLGVSLKRSQPR